MHVWDDRCTNALGWYAPLLDRTSCGSALGGHFYDHTRGVAQTGANELRERVRVRHSSAEEAGAALLGQCIEDAREALLKAEVK